MLRQPCPLAPATISSGESRWPLSPPSFLRGAWEISQFWQNEQRKLQPAVAMENASDPG
jgi:hypothetical protein